jgi:hypothetical protein
MHWLERIEQLLAQSVVLLVMLLILNLLDQVARFDYMISACH